jgi:hypothetical protein
MLTETSVTGPDTPATAKLTTKGAPYCGGVPASPSGIAPTPVPGNVAAGETATVLPALFETALVGFEPATNHKAAATTAKTVTQYIKVRADSEILAQDI